MMSMGQDAIVILTPAFSLDPDDQWLPFQGSFIRTLKERHPWLRIVVIAFHYPVRDERNTSWEGAEVILLGGGMKGGFHSPGRWAQAWRALNRIRKASRIVGILSMFCSESAFVGHYFAKRHGLRHRIWILGQDARAVNKQVARIRPAPDELVAISDFLVREFEASHGIRPAHCIPIGIRPEDFGPPAAARPIDIIGAGTLSPIKQYDVFIEIIAGLRGAIPGIRAVICGGGSELRSLRQKIAALGLEGHVELMPGLNRPQVLAIMQQSRVLLHTSAYEGFGMVCTEALYAGATVVSFVRPMDAPIPGWYFADDAGDMAALAQRLLADDTPALADRLPFAMSDTVAGIMNAFGYAGH